MDKAAIETLVGLGIEAHQANRLETYTPAIILGNEIKSIENLGALRSRFRGRFDTIVPEQFAAYLATHKGGKCFIDPKGFTATAFLNLGTIEEPGHADWVAVLAMARTAAYKALLGIDGHAKSQREAAEWVEDWAPILKAFDGDKEMNLSAAVQAIRAITIAAKKEGTSTEGHFGSRRTGMEEIEAKSEKGLPTRLVMTTQTYHGMDTRQIAMRVSVITSEPPKIVFRIVNGEALEEDLLLEFAAMLTEGLKASATPVTIGTFKP